MSVRSLVARLAAGGLLVGLALLGPASAQAADGLTTVVRLDDIKLQACKVPTDGGRSWLVRARVQNRSEFVATATMTAFRNGNRTRRTWESGEVRPRSTSRFGTVVIPRPARGWTLVSTLANGNAGNGNERTIRQITRC